MARTITALSSALLDLDYGELRRPHLGEADIMPAPIDVAKGQKLTMRHESNWQGGTHYPSPASNCAKTDNNAGRIPWSSSKWARARP